MIKIKFLLILTIGVCIFSFLSIQTAMAQQYPFTDPTNTGNWILNTEVSDEFETSTLDEVKWLIQGTGGVWMSNFHGRAPSQFSLNNVRVENGKLILQTRWEPDYPFNPLYDPKGVKYENFTTSAVISKKQLLYGYMEIKAKTANVSIQSSFWMTGQNSELDVYENNGNPSLAGKEHLRTEFWSSIHNWSPGAGGVSVWTNRSQLPFMLAGDFHVYGCEWTEEFAKFYADGILYATATKEELGSNWVLTNPLWIWVDNETFTWQGVPAESDLPADYEIEYVRAWQHALVLVTDVTVSPTSASLIVGETASLTATVSPADATDKTVTWSSGNESVATVNTSGVVTAVSEGSATITVTTNDSNKTAVCSVTVSPATGISPLTGNEEAEKINLYPNPYTGGELTVEIPDNPDVSVNIFDLHGKAVFSYKYKGQSTIKINPSKLGLNKGLYIVKVHGNNKSLLGKLVIE